jgi:hypothetical protein
MDNEWAINRDADRYAEDKGYLARTMERAAHRIEEFAKDLPDGYRKHWHLVDAALLRREAANISSAEKRTGIAESASL